MDDAKPIETILISVLYNYYILKEACVDTQNELQVGLTIIYQVVQARHTYSMLSILNVCTGVASVGEMEVLALNLVGITSSI